MVLVVSSTKLVSRKSSFVATIVYDALWQVPTGEPIANPITGILIDTWVGRMYLEILDLLLLLLS
jgi:hypothetical protein